LGNWNYVKAFYQIPFGSVEDEITIDLDVTRQAKPDPLNPRLREYNMIVKMFLVQDTLQINRISPLSGDQLLKKSFTPKVKSKI
jgi:hypothetical protein